MLQQMPGWRRGVFDDVSGDWLKLATSPEIGKLRAEFSHSGLRFLMPVEVRPKDQSLPVADSKLVNPGVMIPVRPIESALLGFNLRDIESNTKSVDRFIHMVAFIIAKHPITKWSLMWSDYDHRIDNPVFRMPSDEELYKICVEAQSK